MNRKALLLLLAIGVLLVYVFTQGQPFPSQLTILTVSRVKIQPEGYVDEEGKVRDSFWITTMLTDCTDKAAGWKFNNASDRDRYYEGEEVQIKSEISIVIDPEQPYWTRPLEVHSHQVYPKTYGTKITVFQAPERTDDSVSSLSVNSYQFGARADVPNVWAVHTPFWITLKKNGVELEKELVDTVGMVETIVLTNPSDESEYITLKNLGKLGTGYGQPSISDIICIEKQLDYCFSGSDEVENKINYDASDYAYSNYWFGGGSHYTTPADEWSNYVNRKVLRWSDGTPKHTYIQDNLDYLVRDEWFPGSYREDGFGYTQVKPFAADVWHSNFETNPHGWSLVNYLKQYHNTLDVDVWKCGAEITDDNFLKVSLPFSSVNSLITLQISTELADTIVWKPQIANVKFVSCEWETGGTEADIQDRLKAVLEVKQHSTVKSTATITPVLEKSDQPIALNPVAHTVDLRPNETETVKFEFLNLGTDEDLENTVTFIVKNTLGVETDRASLTFTLKKKGVAETILTVHTIDAETEMDVSGIPVTVTYDSSSLTDYTIEGTAVFDLEGVEGKVIVRSSETSEYRGSAPVSTTVKSGEPNVVTLRLYRKGVEPEPFPWWLIVVVVLATGAIVYFATRKKEE